MLGDIREHGLRHFDPSGGGFGFQNRSPRYQIRRVDLDDHAGYKSSYQFVTQAQNTPRVLACRKNDWGSLVIERVEGILKLDHRSAFRCQKLNVVDDQPPSTAKPCTESIQA